jgi:hypothetical protein
MSVVFVNYRVREQAGYATFLHRELVERFGPESVFLASRSLRAGDDFVCEVFDRVRRSSVVLALIGVRWLEFGRDDGADWVRREIAEAFASGVRVVPVLVDEAELPDEDTLPGDIAALARCQCLRLRHYSIESDLGVLVEELRRIAPALESLPRARPETMASGEPVYFRHAQRPEWEWRIGVLPGTVRRVTCADVWVNSENTDMQMARHNEFSVSSIIRYWGAVRDEAGHVVNDVIADELTARLGPNRQVAPGTAIVTGPGALAASNNVRHVIHVATVSGEPGAGFQQVRNVGWCVTNALSQAERLAAADPEVRSVLFPLFGTGAMVRAPIEPTARVMLLAALDHLAAHPDTPLRTLYFLAYTAQEKSVIHEVLRTLPVELVK